MPAETRLVILWNTISSLPWTLPCWNPSSVDVKRPFPCWWSGTLRTSRFELAGMALFWSWISPAMHNHHKSIWNIFWMQDLPSRSEKFACLSSIESSRWHPTSSDRARPQKIRTDWYHQFFFSERHWCSTIKLRRNQAFHKNHIFHMFFLAGFLNRGRGLAFNCMRR